MTKSKTVYNLNEGKERIFKKVKIKEKKKEQEKLNKKRTVLKSTQINKIEKIKETEEES